MLSYSWTDRGERIALAAYFSAWGTSLILLGGMGLLGVLPPFGPVYWGTLVGIITGGLLAWYWSRRGFARNGDNKDALFQIVFSGGVATVVIIISTALLTGIEILSYPTNRPPTFLIVPTAWLLILVGILPGGLLFRLLEKGWERWKESRSRRTTVFASDKLPTPRKKGVLGWSWRRALVAALALLALLIIGAFWVVTEPAKKPAVPTVTPTIKATVAATATITPTTALPTPTPLPSATATVLIVPPPPTGTPIPPPTVVPASRTPAATTIKPTTTRTAVPAPVCTYSTAAGDTWASVARKLEVPIAALMQKNPGMNPAAVGTVLKIPRTGCQ